MAKTAKTAKEAKSSDLGKPGNNQPLFFNDPWPVDASRHNEAGIRRQVGFDFARNTNSVPISIHEFVEVSRSYPIIFTQEEIPMPLAVLGLKQHNCFVTDNGQWRRGHYLPGYVRKYPFALLELKEKKQFILCVDESSPHFQATNPDLPLYENGEPGAISKEAIEICRRYHGDHLATREFCKALSESGLLEAKEIQAELPGGQKHGIAGFQLISEEKWLALADKEFLKWRKQQWAGLIYLAMASQANWKYIAQLEAQQ